MGQIEELEKRVEAGERRLRHIIGRAPDGILVLDSEGVVLFANPAAEALMGLGPGGLRGREFGFPTVAGETTEIDIAGRHGETRLAEMRVVETEWDGAFAVVAALRDITDRKRSEIALRESEARYREVFESAFTANSITTPAGDLLACNRAFLRIFGFRSLEEARSRNVATLYPDPARRAAFLERLQLGRVLESFEVEMRRADGTPVHVIENVFGSFGPDGELESISAYLLDVSERKSLEEQLRHAQKMEAVGRLAGGLAHDFNNLLTVIVGRASMALENAPAGSDFRETADEILRAAERAAAITGRLLAFSRRQFTRLADIPLDDVLLGMERLLRSAAGDNVRLRLLPGGAGVIRADQSQIEQAILNLVINARDAMPGGGAVTIETGAADLEPGYAAAHLGLPPGRYASLSVSDTGHGIPPEIRERLFEPFFSTKEPGKGTGLGLSTVYGIVKQGGGGIMVDSEPGQGARFRIHLPSLGEAAEKPVPGPAPSGASRGTETVLIVDDDPAVLRVAAGILEARGYAVIGSSDPLAALRVAGAGRIDLLLTDVVMPGINGRELAGRVRQARPGLPVLYMSGFNEDEFFQNGVDGADAAFVTKPFTPDTLGRRVRELLDRTSP